MGIRNIFSRKKNKTEWPLKPPRHAEDKHCMMNEYQAFGIHQLLGSKIDVEGNLLGVDMFTIVLMENGYGERYANVLKNGILVTDSTVVRQSVDWQNVIQPWLEDKTDIIPIQDGIICAALATQLHQIRNN